MTPPCILCEARESAVLESAPDGVRVLRCTGCGLVRLHPTPGVNAASHYDAEYYRPWREAQAASRAKLWRRRLRLLSAYAAPGRLLDVGCGEGSFLRATRDRGWQVTGTEVSRWAVETLRAQHALTVLQGDVSSLPCPRESFDAVTMWHVLEHTPQPLETLRTVVRLLRPRGILVAAVPNAACRLFRAAYLVCKRRALRYYTPGERELHLYHFTADTLRAVLHQAGFEILLEGVDENALTLPRRALQRAATLLHSVSGVNWAEALLVVATPRRCGQ